MIRSILSAACFFALVGLGLSSCSSLEDIDAPRTNAPRKVFDKTAAEASVVP